MCNNTRRVSLYVPSSQVAVATIFSRTLSPLLSAHSSEMRHSYSFGPPKDRGNQGLAGYGSEPTVIETCADKNLISIDSKYAYIECGFAHEPFWHRVDSSTNTGEGIAAVKVRLHTKHRDCKHLNQVECNLIFSQTLDGQFQGVHRCWPSLRGTPTFENVGKAYELAPTIGVSAISLALGKATRGSDKSLQSNWIVISQQRQTEPRPGDGYNVFVIV